MVKKYIDFNTDKRRNAVISFDIDFFKLMNNSVYGKTMENLRKRIKIRLVNNAKDYKKYVRRPSIASHEIFNKHIVAIQEIKLVLTLGKPIYVVFSIIYLMKCFIY